MNCKPGDLAVIVRSISGNLGLIVNVLHADERPRGAPAWVVESGKPLRPGKKYWWVFDSQLRPIRDQPGEDETLQWAPVPQQKETVS